MVKVGHRYVVLALETFIDARVSDDVLDWWKLDLTDTQFMYSLHLTLPSPLNLH